MLYITLFLLFFFWVSFPILHGFTPKQWIFGIEQFYSSISFHCLPFSSITFLFLLRIFYKQYTKQKMNKNEQEEKKGVKCKGKKRQWKKSLKQTFLWIFSFPFFSMKIPYCFPDYENSQIWKKTEASRLHWKTFVYFVRKELAIFSTKNKRENNATRLENIKKCNLPKWGKFDYFL